MMPLVGRLGKVLGLVWHDAEPEDRHGTMDVTTAEGQGGLVEFRVEKAGILQAGVGKASFSEEKLVQNVKALADAVAKAVRSRRNSASSVAVSSTMGPGEGRAGLAARLMRCRWHEVPADRATGSFPFI
jgi:large subunit ribosomal protein L1